MSVTIKLKRGNSSDWTSQNIILASGEPGYEINTGRFKIGNGLTAWSGLPYASVVPTGLLAGSGININLGTNGSTATISVSGLNSTYISDFNEAVDDRIGSGLFVAGTGINLTYNDAGNSFTVSTTGLISNPTNNRILTSRDSTTTGIDAESNLTFNGSLLNVSGNLTAHTGTIDILQFNTNNGAVSSQGQMGWNATQGTIDLALTSTAIIELGEHQMYRVRNTTSNTLYRGQVVYASGVHPNGIITPNLYVANETIEEIRLIGLIYEDINNNNNGHVIAFGHMYNIDTRGNVASNIAVGDETWADGDILYAHPTVAGKLTKVAPKHNIPIALILDAANNGKMYVRRDLGPGDLDEIHDVNVSGATNGQFLQYNSATSYWVASSSGNFTTLLVNGTGVSVSGHTHTSSQITDFNSSVSGLLPTIANSGDNRILTSTGTTTGINAESNATFNGSTLAVSGNLIVSVTGDINTLKINNFYHNNLSVATGLADGDLLIAIIDPTGTPTTEVIQGSILRNTLLNQPAQLQFRQGTNAERLLITPASGEPIWTTDTQKFYIGDGSTVGGDFIGPSPYDRSSGTQSITALNTTCVASGEYSSVLGGNNCRISDNSDYSSVVGGFGSTLTNSNNSFIGGGYTCSITSTSAGYHNSIVGGINNTITGNFQASFLGGGYDNAITNSYAVICGGGNGDEVGNTASGYGSSIVGGAGNNTTANYSFVGGGYSNNSTSTNSAIAGGTLNTASGVNSCVLGGTSNVAGGQNAAVGGGTTNNASGQNSIIGGGSTNTASGSSSAIGGGNTNSATALASTVPGGFRAKATRYGELSHAAGYFAVVGDAQHTILVARKTTTDATANQVLFLDNSSARLTLPAETTWTFSIKLSAYNDTDNEGGWWIFRGGIRRNAANGTALIGSIITENGVESTLSTASASVVADDTNEALEIRVTGVVSKNIRWVAVVDISQVSYGTP